MTDVPGPDGATWEKSSRGRGLTIDLTADEVGVLLGALTVADRDELAVYLKAWFSDEAITPAEAARLKYAIAQRLLRS
jgi:hypothetical protein